MSGSKEDLREAKRRRFNRYPAYKYSGIEWLPEVPEHWGLKRLKYLSSINSESIPENTDPSRAMTYVDIGGVDGRGRIVHAESMLLGSAPSRARRLVRHGDIIVSTVRTYLRAIAVIDRNQADLVVSTGFAVIRPTKDLATDFAAYALRAPYFVDRVVANSKGVSFPAIAETEMATYELLVPPPSEQRAIAEFLDRETARIDGLVAKKERLIDLLNEERAAVITRAVTKGLDPNVATKDSGVEWLGEIPAHWAVKKLKALSSLQTGVTLGKRYDSQHLTARPYLRVANVQDGYLDLTDVATIELPSSEVGRYELRGGDVLLTEGGDFDKLGRGHVWEGEIPGCLHQNHIFSVRPMLERLDPHFVAAVMASDYGRAYFTATSKQSTNLASTNSTKLKNFPLPLPTPTEQQEILTRIAAESNRLDALAGDVSTAIDRLNELRAALIAAAVTGQIDAREEVA